MYFKHSNYMPLSYYIFWNNISNKFHNYSPIFFTLSLKWMDILSELSRSYYLVQIIVWIKIKNFNLGASRFPLRDSVLVSRPTARALGNHWSDGKKADWKETMGQSLGSYFWKAYKSGTFHILSQFFFSSDISHWYALALW